MYDKVCKKCGTLLSEFYNTGMLGCEYCYMAFEKEILTALKKIQGRTFHTGKTQKLSAFDRELLAEYNALIKEKERATIEGRFTDIRELAEQILSLSEELRSRGLM
jgi:protein-arginine kinase activator protein McsA